MTATTKIIKQIKNLFKFRNKKINRKVFLKIFKIQVIYIYICTRLNNTTLDYVNRLISLL